MPRNDIMFKGNAWAVVGLLHVTVTESVCDRASNAARSRVI